MAWRAEQLLELRQGPGPHVLEAFAAGDAEVGQVPEALLQFGGELRHDLGEGEALPGAEVDLPELRDGLGC